MSPTVEDDGAARWRLRTAASCAVLVAIAFAQDPGRVVTDTKLDLVVAPWRFLQRALQMWDPQQAFGQVANQGYGYLFPMGPFFALGDTLQLPPWVVQRLWWALLLVVAFLGFVTLARVLGIGTPWARILAGFAFALSPRILSVMGPSSIEVWPSALAPWVLVPLVVGLRRGDPRRMAALSALAVAAVGGVNAAATFAVVPLGALWLLCSPRGPRRRALMLWWPPLVGAATLWWLVPLFLLGRYSPPFLDYIESIDNTAFSATLLDTLRGTSNWVPYIDANAVAGRDLVSDPLLIANGFVVLGLGVLGLMRSDLPFRRVWVAGLVVGMIAVASGHAGATHGWFSGEARSLLDGVLAPLRNTHKFDVLLRLPLVLGLCHAVTVLSRRGTETHWVGSFARRGPAVLACVALLGATVPAWTGGIAPRDSFSAVPDYWKQAAGWLGRHDQGVALLTPATPFGDYVWGRASDEPMQPLATSPWAVRNLVPLAPGGNVEMLDTVSQQLATGRGTAGLATFLRRAGIGTLVVRHDVDRAQGVTSPELVRSTLATTPGMSRVASFGPTVGGGARLDDRDDSPFVDAGWQAPRPAVEVFAFDDPVPSTFRQSLDATPVLVGDSDSLAATDSWNLLGGRSVVMAPETARDARPSSVVLADGNRRQEQAFGAVDRQRSATLTPAERYTQDRRVHRYDQDAVAPWLTVPHLVGARSLTASSSRSDVGALPSLDQSAGPWSAFDSDLDTAWRPDADEDGTPSTLRLELDRLTDLGTVSITLDAPQDRATSLVVSTATGPRTVRVQGRGPARVDVGRVGALTVRGTSTTGAELAVADVSSPALSLSRPLRLPSVPSRWGAPDAIVLDGDQGVTDGCTTIDGVVRCSSAQERVGEGGRTIDRQVVLPEARRYGARVRVTPYGGTALDELLQRGRLGVVSASSQVTHGAQASPVTAIDGDPDTGWIASPDDEDPTLSVRWVRERRVSGLRLVTDDQLAASRPTQVRLVFADGSSVTEDVADDGTVRFPTRRTSSVAVHLDGTEKRASVGFDGSVRTLPVGVSELRVTGGALRFGTDETVRTLPCGTGPTVTVDDQRVRTAVRASTGQLARGETVPARLCGGSEVRLREGLNRLVVGGAAAFRPAGVVLGPRVVGGVASAGGSQLRVETHNANAGWAATARGRALRSQVVNGWQQGWVEPADATDVDVSYGPEPVYRVGIALGALAALMVLVLGLRRGRRQRPDADPVPGPLGPRARALLAGGVLVLGGVLAGWSGLVVGVVALALTWATQARHEGLRAPAALVALAFAGGFAVLHPWAGFGSWSGQSAVPQLAVLLVVLLVVAGSTRRPRSLSRRNGRSTTR